MPVITFYEVNEAATVPSRFPKLSDIEGVIFDYINDQGAASLRSVVRQSRSQGYSQAETATVITSLVSKNLITRRNLKVELDESLKP